ncbi:MAG TPA: MFS transporter, partial [Vicinamibacteria bacterium]|nr:MFS transporter [Vicinamibacteria bacterium]
GLNLTPLAFGVIDGLYLGSSALVRLIAGYWADRTRRHKEVAVSGYALSALSRLGLLVAGGAWPALVTVILVDRLGKGIRTAPRDALISLSSPRADLATAFGVHRALDTAGAMIGPLIAFGLLTLAPGSFDAIFVVSLCAALIGLGILTLFVENRPLPAAGDEPRPQVSPGAVMRLVRTSGFGPLLGVGGLLSLVTISDGFLYLTLQRRLDFNLGLFPLLYVVTALIYMLLAVPVGKLADRLGRGWVFVGGYTLLLLLYALLLLPVMEMPLIVICLVLFGAYYAATDGVLMALASATLPEELRTSGLALLTTVTSLGRLAASILFGLLWTWLGVGAATLAFAAGLLAAMALALGLLVTRRSEVAGG